MDKFAQIISASRDAAHPTATQAASGNYRKGRVTLYGLKIAIETAQGTRRVGKTDGEPWSVISQAHYGELVGTKASDGDPLDVFIGPWPETEMVYVINQVNKDGSFDEVKIMLCFPSEESARNAYMNSYERGWNGLGSLVRCTVEQLKWWIKFGNTTLPLAAKSLPYDGNAEMNETVWDSAANPVGTDLAGLIYALRRTDADGLLLDAVTVADIMEDADAEMALDALVIPLNKLERKMQQMQVIMAGIGEAVKPIAMQITSPFKQRGTTNVAAIFELSDGQTVSIFFHNPDTTPNKLTPDDEMVSWKWLLNKKDVTILVAPEKGRDLNPREVGRRVMRLAEKNSTRFAAANTKKAERMQSIEVLKQSTAAKEAELVKLQTEIVELTPRVEAKRRTQAPIPAGNDYLPAGWAEVAPGGMATNNDPLVGGIVDREVANKDNWFIVFNNDAIPQDKRAFSSRHEALKAFEQAIAAVKAAEARGHGQGGGKLAEGVYKVRADSQYPIAGGINYEEGYSFLKVFKDGSTGWGWIGKTPNAALVARSNMHPNQNITVLEGPVLTMEQAEAQGQGGNDLPPLTVRNQAVKAALSALGWNTVPSSTQANLDIDGSLYSLKSKQSDKAIEWFDMSTLIATDDLSKTPEAFAAELDAAFRSSVAKARKAAAFNPQNPDDYRQIWGGGGNVQLAEAHQDQLDSLFQGRLIAVRNALRDLGWEGEKFKALSKGGNTLVADLWQVGAGKNIVGIVYKVTGPSTTAGAADGVRDDLSVTPAELAAEIDGLVSKAVAEDADPKMHFKSATLLWSEGSMDENKEFVSLVALDQWFKATFPTKRMEERGVGRGYWKNKLVIRSTDESGNAQENTTRVDVSRTQGDFDPTKQTIAQYLSKEGFGSVSPGMAEIVDAPDRHYSEVIKDELVSSYGWKRTSTGSLSKDLSGADTGGEFNKEGSRIVYASFDEAGRYLTLQSGFGNVFDMDCRDLDPKEAAAAFNARVAEWADNASGATGRRGLSAKDRAWAERIVANEDAMPWADVRRAKEMLGLPTESDDADLLKTPEGRKILADRMRSGSAADRDTAIAKFAAEVAPFLTDDEIATVRNGAVPRKILADAEALGFGERRTNAALKDALDAELERAKAEGDTDLKGFEDVNLSELQKKPAAASIRDWFRVNSAEGIRWSAGSTIVDYANEAPVIRGWESRKDVNRDKDTPTVDADRIKPSNSGAVLEPVAIERGIAKGRHAVYLESKLGDLVAIDLAYAQYFLSQYKARAELRLGKSGSVGVFVGGEAVGVIAAMRGRNNIQRVLAKFKAGVRAPQAEAEQGQEEQAGEEDASLSESQKAIKKAGFDPDVYKKYPGMTDAIAAGATNFVAIRDPGKGHHAPHGYLSGNGIKWPMSEHSVELAKQLSAAAKAAALKAEAESGVGAPEPAAGQDDLQEKYQRGVQGPVYVLGLDVTADPAFIPLRDNRGIKTGEEAHITNLFATQAEADAANAKIKAARGRTEPADDTALSDSRAFLQSVIDGQADMMTPDLADQLTKIAEDYADDESVMALFNEAAEAYSNFMIAEARKALA